MQDKQRETYIESVTCLLQKHIEYLQQLCATKVHGDYEESRDLLQDIIESALLRREELAGMTSESQRYRWLYFVARRVIFKHFQLKHHRIPTQKMSSLSDILDKESLATQLDEVMDLAREALTDNEMKIISLRIEGYTYAEIADIMGINDVALRKMMERAIIKIRKYHNIIVKK